ncbi:MAG: hypothetical protein GQ548_04365 [Methylophaga sp.]|nr:hypothetical protein [Methylophaga sp.]
MTAFRVKLCGLNDGDTHSLKSMLNLTHEQLVHNWEIVTSEQADLYIYSFDSEEGKTAWQQHNEQDISVLLSSQKKSTETVDFILKKPLRTKNFSDALNTIATSIMNKSNNNIAPPSSVKTITTKQQSKIKPSFFSNFSATISGLIHKKPPRIKPELQFSLPPQQANISNTIVEPDLLKNWLQEIDSKVPSIIVSDILGNLIPLNRLAIPPQERFQLLELYTFPINTLIHSQHTWGSKLASKSHADYIKTIHALGLLLEELAIGYKTIIYDYYQHEKHPNDNSQCLTAINRASEYINLFISFYYRHYLALPDKALNNLHQLYLYNEFYQTLQKKLPQSDGITSHSFSQNYNKVLLTGIANPSRLTRTNLTILSGLMTKFADNINIIPLTTKQIQEFSEDHIEGHFCIDMSDDKMPISLTETPEGIKALPQSRLFDTQQILEAIEYIFQHKDIDDKSVSGTSEIQLLKIIIPQFNATYIRNFKRKALKQAPKTNIAIGLTAIHFCLIQNSTSQTSRWAIHNKSRGGMMVSNDTLDSYTLNIGDSVGIFESDSQATLAIIRWITTNKAGITSIGLEFQNTHPKAVNLTPKNKTVILLGLLLPASSVTNLKQENTILVEHEAYLPLQELDVSEGNLKYKISVDTLINNTFNDKQFSYTIRN